MRLLTDWYPAKIKPIRNGFYLARIHNKSEGALLLWESPYWFYPLNRSITNPISWRGVTFDAERTTLWFLDKP